MGCVDCVGGEEGYECKCHCHVGIEWVLAMCLAGTSFYRTQVQNCAGSNKCSRLVLKSWDFQRMWILAFGADPDALTAIVFDRFGVRSYQSAFSRTPVSSHVSDPRPLRSLTSDKERYLYFLPMLCTYPLSDVMTE